MLATAVLCSCAHTLLAPDDRARVCQVAVEEKSEAPQFHGNPFFNPVGGPALGALGAATTFFYIGPFAIAIAAQGAGCGAASVSHPSTEAELQRAFQTADRGALKRALEADLNAPRTGCAGPSSNVPAAPARDNLVEIERIDYGMNCPEKVETSTRAPPPTPAAASQ